MYLLIQARDDDYMRQHELQCFARAAGVPTSQFDLLDAREQPLPLSLLDAYDAFFIGGSGEYCVSKNLRFLEPVEAFVREAAVRKRPLLGVCFGFHIMARAYGAAVQSVERFSETGTFAIHCTEAGRQDRLFATLPPTFYGHEGHNDTVMEMPEPLLLLARSDRCPTQA
ncbi:MAG: type 1 glutamine amidotransferase, partial [Candidatus Xenobia bacterium]